MKVKRKIISVLLSLLIFTQIISTCKFNSYAAGGYFTEDSFSLTPNAFTPLNSLTSYSAYTMQNDSGLLSGFYYYMKIEDGKAICCDAGEVITNILNYKIGITMSAQTLANFISSYAGDNVYTGQDPNYYNICKPVLKGGSLCGIALNNITGCRMAYSEDSDNVTIPSSEVNNVYNYFLYYQIQNPITPDIINVPTFSQVYCDSNWTTSTTATGKDKLNDSSNLPKFNISATYWTGGVGWYYGGTRNNYNYFESTTEPIYVGFSGFNTICNAFELTDTQNTISLDNFLASSGTDTLSVNCYSNDGTLLKKVDKSGTVNSYTQPANNTIDILSGYSKQCGYTINGDYLTVYKTINIKNNITNNTYQKTYYVTTNYNNYNTNSDNGYSSNVQNINNSTSNNTNIYNETKTTTNNNIKNNNYVYDNDVIDNSTTTIINNYYGDNGSGGDDNGGGGGDDDDSIWRALLAAISDFFRKIGELLATILTGIITLFTDIIGAITQITTGFTAITDFLGSVFSWLPTEIIAILTLGLSLGVFICLIKLFK